MSIILLQVEQQRCFLSLESGLFGPDVQRGVGHVQMILKPSKPGAHLGGHFKIKILPYFNVFEALAIVKYSIARP